MPIFPEDLFFTNLSAAELDNQFNSTPSGITTAIKKSSFSDYPGAVNLGLGYYQNNPTFLENVRNNLIKGAQYYGGANIGAGITAALGASNPITLLLGAIGGGKILGGADATMTPMDKYNLSTYGGYGPMGVQDKYGINTVSLFGNYDNYIRDWNDKYGTRKYTSPQMIAKQAAMAKREQEIRAQAEAQRISDLQSAVSSGRASDSGTYDYGVAAGDYSYGSSSALDEGGWED